MTTGYTVIFSQLASERFERLIHDDRRLGEQLAKAIDRLAAHPDAGEWLKGEWKGYRKYRMGDYRIVYRIEHHRLIIYIITLGHRKHVYQEFR